MIHYTCDVCGKDLVVEEDARFEVRIEVKIACEPKGESSDDPEEDFDAQVSDILELMQGVDKADLERGVYKSFRYDLCADCKESYLEDPLFRRRVLRLQHSEN
ncbi:MAG: hypothetical protein HY720_03100 [Planctomycetes bacterium]|nr:hypothetical protein [Planctomycetota bacterium]